MTADMDILSTDGTAGRGSAIFAPVLVGGCGTALDVTSRSLAVDDADEAEAAGLEVVDDKAEEPEPCRDLVVMSLVERDGAMVEVVRGMVGGWWSDGGLVGRADSLRTAVAEPRRSERLAHRAMRQAQRDWALNDGRVRVRGTESRYTDPLMVNLRCSAGHRRLVSPLTLKAGKCR